MTGRGSLPKCGRTRLRWGSIAGKKAGQQKHALLPAFFILSVANARPEADKNKAMKGILTEIQGFAKLSRPNAAGAFPRNRLFSLLKGKATSPVVWISAPAGSGKTTLVSSWVEHQETACLWYRADGGDADPATFFHYLGLAAKAAAPRKKTALPRLTPEYLPALPVFTRRFMESFFPTLKKGTTVVIDDFQAAADGASFVDVVLEMISALPQGMKLIVLSRADPPSAFARLSVNGVLRSISWEEMRFTLDETEGFLAARQGDAAGAQGMQDASGGWAAGLVLLERLGATGADGAAPGGRNDLFDYFMTEVFRTADEETAGFLLRTAFFPEFTEAMAEEIPGTGHARTILHRLVRKNFFIERYSGHPVRYRYHQLFREFLLRHGTTCFGDEERKAAIRFAAGRMAEAGHREEAADLFVDAQAWDALRSLIMAAAPELIGQGRQGVVQKWAAALPSSQSEGDAWLRYWIGMSRHATAPEKALDDFLAAFEAFLAREDTEAAVTAWCGLIDSAFYGWQRLDQVQGWIERVRETLRSREVALPPARELNYAFSLVMALSYVAPLDPELPVRFRQVESLVNGCPDPGAAAALKFKLAQYYLHNSGEFDKLAVLAAEYERGEVAVQSMSFLDILWNWAVIYGTWQMGADIEPSRIDDLVRRVAEEGIVIWNFHLYALGFMINLQRGRREEASRYLGLMAREKRADRLLDTGTYEMFAARHACEDGRYETALDHGMATLRCAHLHKGVAVLYGYVYFMLVDLYLKCGKNEQAREALSQLEETVRVTGSRTIRYRALLAAAYLAVWNGERAEAMAKIAAAFALGRENRYLRLDWFCSDVMRRLCLIALEEGIETEHARRLIAAWGLTPGMDCIHIDAWPWPVKVRTLGIFDVRVADKPIDTGKRSQQKPLALLRLLASIGPDGIATSRLADMLWPEAEGDKAQHALEMALSRLRKLLQRDDAVDVRAGRVRLNRSLCWVDARAFAETADAGLDHLKNGKPDAGKRMLEQALPLYRGHFADNDGQDQWALSARERLRMKYLYAIEALADVYEQAGDSEKALDLYRKGIEVDELSEELCRKYMGCCLHLGRRSEALSAYRRLERALKNVMGIAPSAETRKMIEAN